MVMAERPRAKSESPGRVDDQRHPSSQVHWEKGDLVRVRLYGIKSMLYYLDNCITVNTCTFNIKT